MTRERRKPNRSHGAAGWRDDGSGDRPELLWDGFGRPALAPRAPSLYPSLMRLLLLVLVALGLACNRQSPVSAYTSFIAAAHKGDSDRVWALLSKASQAQLDARAKTAAAAAPDVMSSSGKALVLGNAIDESVPVKQDGVEMLRESADRAVVKVVDAGGRSREVTLVQETGWRIDLTGLLLPTPKAP